MKLALLDVGAGESPFRSICENLGFRYQSQDFNQYIPDPELPGLQNDSWNYGTHDLVCDILDIPEHDTYDVLLCTEVLEHVPDPRAVFSKLRRLASPGAHIIVTVPLHSLIHQAPFWFSSGLSPFWFQNAARQEGVLIEELFVGGDYADFISQEINRTLSGLQLWFPANFAAKALGRIMGKSAKVFRRLLPTSILGSGGFGTFFVGKCPEIEP